MSDPSIQEAKRTLSRQLMQDPRISGVGIEGDAIQVYLAEDDPDLVDALPAVYEGYDVTYEVVGRVTQIPGE
jgi:hypothetical protein